MMLSTDPRYRQHARIKNLETNEIREIDHVPGPFGLFLQDGKACYGLRQIRERGFDPNSFGREGCPGILIVPKEELENLELWAPMKMTSR